MLFSEGIRYTINSGGNIVYRIAICDDEINVCTGLEEMLQKIMQEFNVQFEIEPWFSGERLCQDLDAGNRYELIFLDIQMLTLNGIDVGKLIRNDLNDFKTQIVYSSYHKDYAIHLFKTQPLDFLVKPLAYDAVKDVIRTFLKLEEKKKVFFEYHIGNNYYKQPCDDIVYLQSDDKKIQMILFQEKKEFYGKLKTIMSQLPSNFLQIHQSFAVNQDYVKEYAYEKATMINGHTLSISRPYRNIVREKLIRKKEGGGK